MFRLTSLVLSAAAALSAQAIRPGIFAAREVDALQLETRGYQVYMVGEAHGIAENAEFQTAYLKALNAAGLRDVALEEDAVYEANAEAFVAGETAALSPHLCLRAPMLEVIRKINEGRPAAERIRVHLTDIDSPAFAVRQHLDELKARLHAANVAVPADAAIKTQGLEAVAKLKPLVMSNADRSALRTIEYSIIALQQGLEVDIGPTQGSPYQESREEAVARNIAEIAARAPVLVLYGSDHVSRTPRTDGGPERNQRLNPVALRLQNAGLKVYAVITTPLEGRFWWRGQSGDFLGGPSDGELSTGETMDKVLAAAPAARYFRIDPLTERKAVPSSDVSKMKPDFFVLFRKSTPMTNSCPAK
jgi:hypothetical protein